MWYSSRFSWTETVPGGRSVFVSLFPFRVTSSSIPLRAFLSLLRVNQFAPPKQWTIGPRKCGFAVRDFGGKVKGQHNLMGCGTRGSEAETKEKQTPLSFLFAKQKLPAPCVSDRPWSES